MMYLIVILVASILVNILLFVERLSLLKALAKSDKLLRSANQQLQLTKQTLTHTCRQLQEQLLRQLNDKQGAVQQRVGQVLEHLIERLPAIIQTQAQTGHNYVQVLQTLPAEEGCSVEELTEYFKEKNRAWARLWQMRDPNALMKLLNAMMNQRTESKASEAPPAS
ncbi:hypothetical protein K0504_14615 [Neiella marina]|uniref:Uncharacterized protein n=1 Tax=Neiella holothuriorum TaxID=2870530 RepID=A0ABS7EIT7_9GAMM|nr:hypothetical protein [Neiella holothuriorum]MBW8192267.1 hypothetical protein [Neiella holothuriorum]